MSNKNPETKHLEKTKWKKGVSPNPKGRPKCPVSKKAMRGLTQRELEKIGRRILQGNLQDIAILRDKERRGAIPLVDAMILAIVGRIIGKGDAKAFNNLLDRLVGKVQQDINVTGDVAAPRVIITMPDNGRKL